MLRIQHILFPTDFSAAADQARDQAVRLAERYGAILHALHVIELYPVDETIASDALPPEIVAETRAKQQPLPDDVLARDFPTYQTTVRDLSAAAAILRYAEAHAIDLIVLGTHGRRGVDRLLMGSVAEAVVRQATCPVFTVRNAPESFTHLLAPVDFSTHARTTLRYARELAALYDAHLDVLHIVPELSLPGIYGLEADPLAPPEIALRSRETLRALCEADLGTDVRWDIHLSTGHVAHQILDFAKERPTNLIVIGTHGYTGLRRFLLGSVTEKVVRTAPCPVFTVKSFGRSLLAEKPAAAAATDT